MNISMKNTITGKGLEFGHSVWDPYALSVVDLGQVAATHNDTQFINLNGSYVNNTRLNKRDISITGWAFAGSAIDMEAQKGYLNHFFNPRHEIEIYYRKWKLTFRPNISISYSTSQYDNTKHYCQWMVQGTAHDPLWRLIEAEVKKDAATREVAFFPLVIPMGIGIPYGLIPEEGVYNPINPGHVETGFVMRLIAKEGAVLNPKIIDRITGQFIEVIISMDQGDVVEISTVSGGKYAKFIRGEEEIDILRHVTKKSAMDMVIHVGESSNDLSVTAAENATNLSAVLSFRPGWLEVQTVDESALPGWNYKLGEWQLGVKPFYG